jgi:hypothetical protein
MHVIVASSHAAFRARGLQVPLASTSMGPPFKQVYVDIVSPFRKSGDSVTYPLRRKNSAFVEIISPFRKQADNTAKENALPDSTPTAPSLKRKRSLANKYNGEEEDSAQKHVKRSADKAAPTSPTLSNAPSRIGMSPQPNANDEFPRGFFYCHQCNQKLPSSGMFRTGLVSPRFDIVSRGSAVHFDERAGAMQGKILRALLA